MELTLDIFKNDAFSVISLQRVVDNAPYVPQALGAMRLFDPKPIDTTSVLLYEKDGGFALIPTTERGGPDIQQVRREGRLRALETLRLSKKDTVQAGELLGVANMALPESIRLRTAQELTTERTANLKSDLEATKEFHRLGALQGKLYDADGTTLLVDFFAEYGISTPATIAFDKSDLAAAGTLVDYVERNIRNPIMDTLKNRLLPNTYVAGLVGENMWYWLIGHPDVRERWVAQENAMVIALAINPLLQRPRYDKIEIGGVTFWHYRGSTDGEIEVGTDDAFFFPVGAKDVFNVYWAPGETLADVQQKGKPDYLYLQPDVRTAMASYLDIFVRSYPLYACIFPKALLRGHLQA